VKSVANNFGEFYLYGYDPKLINGKIY
jgi:hypothetical protein